jgi:hypothetical protein
MRTTRNSKKEAPMNKQCAELTLEEMLADPIVQLVMRRDGISGDDVRQVIAEARRRWLASARPAWLQAAE